MDDIVIKIENLSKQYRLGKVGTGTISHDLNRWWAGIRGKEDPYLKIGSENKRDEKGDSDYVWALRDINFEVKRGEVLGIIGKNGAGKSTLLKILSRVTEPTTGELKIKGKIASLLEVGTGFHPELSGKENIFLNGAILGMSKREIKNKFEEIVEFAGVERYIDTPVKRYSSGMYVRLAFAVAAHLEPEILIIDEVLAVGDAEFQKKCLGKMKDVAGNGRTVIFVSHNLGSISSLCSSLILIEEGKIKHNGDVSNGIIKYLNIYKQKRGYVNLSDFPEYRTGNGKNGRLLHLSCIDENGNPVGITEFGGKLIFDIIFEIFNATADLECGLIFINNRGTVCGGCISLFEGAKSEFGNGMHSFKVTIPFINLFPGVYSVQLWIRKKQSSIYDSYDNAIEFEIVENKVKKPNAYFYFYSGTGVYHEGKWEYKKINPGSM